MLKILGIAVLALVAFSLLRSMLGGPRDGRALPSKPAGPPPPEPATGRAPLEEVIRDPGLLALVDGNQFIAAIKVVRERTGLGLKESKDVVDELREKRGKSA